jgi:hypothetical protein
MRVQAGQPIANSSIRSVTNRNWSAIDVAQSSRRQLAPS